jgi:hypothetical protein
LNMMICGLDLSKEQSGKISIKPPTPKYLT